MQGDLRSNPKECEIPSSLLHPHIVEFVGVFDGKGEKALVMELLHETLKDSVWLRRRIKTAGYKRWKLVESPAN